MRRRERRMGDADARALLRACAYGVLSVVGEDGAPYGVPLNYVYAEEEGALFFHCAQEGRKLDGIRREDRVSFAVVGRSEVDAPRFTTLYSSVIAAGRARLVEAENEKRLRLRQLCEALTPGQARMAEVIEGHLQKVAVVRVDIETLSGKANRGEGE